MRTNQIKARAEELLEGYQDARDEEFNNQLRDLMDGIVVSEDDVQGLIDSFTFPEENDWAFDAVQSEIEDIGDQKYMQYKDER